MSVLGVHMAGDILFFFLLFPLVTSVQANLTATISQDRSNFHFMLQYRDFLAHMKCGVPSIHIFHFFCG